MNFLPIPLLPASHAVKVILIVSLRDGFNVQSTVMAVSRRAADYHERVAGIKVLVYYNIFVSVHLCLSFCAISIRKCSAPSIRSVCRCLMQTVLVLYENRKYREWPSLMATRMFFLQARPFCIARESQAHRTASTDGYKNVFFASNLPAECVDKDCVTFIL
jgi:hypothetical protein